MEEIKKRQKEYTEELYKKHLNDLDNYDDVISHPEPDILECEVKSALRITAVNKANGCDGIPVELFKTLKNDAIKVLYSVCQEICKTQQWPQVWKRSILIPVPKKGSTKECSNHRTIALISQASKKKNKCSVVYDSAAPWTVAHQAPLSMGFFQARILEWVAISFSMGSS